MTGPDDALEARVVRMLARIVIAQSPYDEGTMGHREWEAARRLLTQYDEDWMGRWGLSGPIPPDLEGDRRRG